MTDTQHHQPYAVPSPYAGGAPAPAHGAPPFGAPTAYAPRPSQAPLVMSVIALVVSGVLGLMMLVGPLLFGAAMMGFEDEAFGDDGFFGSPTLSGQVAVTDGGVAGTVMESAITRQLQDHGSIVDEMTCPDATDVRQGNTVLCRGDVDGMSWTYLLVFSDADGHYDVAEY